MTAFSVEDGKACEELSALSLGEGKLTLLESSSHPCYVLQTAFRYGR